MYSALTPATDGRTSDPDGRASTPAGTIDPVTWPPQIGEPLPRAEHAYGVHDKIAGYSLKLDHPSGGEKADGFARVLGITAADLDYLAEVLLEGARAIPITAIRDRGEHGVLCQVIVPVRGLGEQVDRTANVLSAWEVRHEDDPPRLVTAYIRR